MKKARKEWARWCREQREYRSLRYWIRWASQTQTFTGKAERIAKGARS
jgi:hypothetical protein